MTCAWTNNTKGPAYGSHILHRQSYHKRIRRRECDAVHLGLCEKHGRISSRLWRSLKQMQQIADWKPGTKWFRYDQIVQVLGGIWPIAHFWVESMNRKMIQIFFSKWFLKIQLVSPVDDKSSSWQLTKCPVVTPGYIWILGFQTQPSWACHCLMGCAFSASHRNWHHSFRDQDNSSITSSSI